MIFLTETVPTKALTAYAKAPIVGSKALRDKAKMLAKIQKKMLAMQGIFFHFINNEWFYESKLNDAIWKKMTPLEKQQFPFETRDLDWKKVLAGFYYGIRRFYIKEDVVSPESGFHQLLAKN